MAIGLKMKLLFQEVGKQSKPKVFPAQTITSTGNLTFSFESNTGITDMFIITAVA